MSNFSTFDSTFNEGASSYRNFNTGDVLMKNSNLEDLTFSLCNYFVNSLVVTDKTIPPQVEYAKTVDTGLTNLKLFEFVANTLVPLIKFADNKHFGEFTILSRIESFSKVSKEEFQEYKDYYLYRSVLDLSLTDVQPLELLRAVRLALQKLVYRFFRTYDPNETHEVGKKIVPVCNASNATFRRGDHNITTDEFRNFIDDLLVACRFMNQFSKDLSEFRNVFSSAASTAKTMRETYNKERYTEKKQYNTSTRKSVSQPSDKIHTRENSNVVTKNDNHHKTNGRFRQQPLK